MTLTISNYKVEVYNYVNRTNKIIIESDKKELFNEYKYTLAKSEDEKIYYKIIEVIKLM